MQPRLLNLRLPPPSGPAVLAISGGRDSVALLHLLWEAGHKDLILCHLNHGLRGRESGQDAAFIRRLAKQYDLVCEVEKADVAGLAAKKGISLEMAGREVRYDFLRRMAEKHGARRIWLAHHADDQAETILANLCRGTGIGGLKGMLMETEDAPSLTLSPKLRRLHPAVLSRVLHFWLGRLACVRDLDSSVVESALAMLSEGGPARINLPGDRHLRRKSGRLWVS